MRELKGMCCQTEAGTFSSVEYNETRKDEVLMAKQDKPTGQREQHGRVLSELKDHLGKRSHFWYADLTILMERGT